MLNGLLRIPSYVPGVIRLWRDRRDVILWRVFVEKVFVICAASLGSPIIRTTSSAISTRKEMTTKLVGRKQFWRNLTFTLKNISTSMVWSKC